MTPAAAHIHGSHNVVYIVLPVSEVPYVYCMCRIIHIWPEMGIFSLKCI